MPLKNGVPLTTYIPAEDAERLRQLAKESDRSIAGEIRHAIHKHLSASVIGGAA